MGDDIDQGMSLGHLHSAPNSIMGVSAVLGVMTHGERLQMDGGASVALLYVQGIGFCIISNEPCLF